MRSGVTRSVVSALIVDETRASEQKVDCSGVETAPLTNDSRDIAVGISQYDSRSAYSQIQLS